VGISATPSEQDERRRKKEIVQKQKQKLKQAKNNYWQ
jgi:hypothetical protein